MQIHLKIAQRHQHQPNNHLNVRQHGMIEAIFHPNLMFWLNLCVIVGSIFDDSCSETKINERKKENKLFSNGIELNGNDAIH